MSFGLRFRLLSVLPWAAKRQGQEQVQSQAGAHEGFSFGEETARRQGAAASALILELRVAGCGPSVPCGAGGPGSPAPLD